jgi:hypothetical protein
VNGKFDGRSGRLSVDRAFYNALTRTGNKVKAQYFFFASSNYYASQVLARAALCFDKAAAKCVNPCFFATASSARLRVNGSRRHVHHSFA